MSLRPLFLLLSCILVLGFAGCSGGSATPGLKQPGCAAGGSTSQTLCLVSCNLGCSQVGCSINQIAQNQPIILIFNQDIDPATVNSSTISFRTAQGVQPIGSYLVNGSRVEFIPEVRTVGSASFFGFTSGLTYIMTLPGGPNELNALRSTAGDHLSQRYICNLDVTRGIIDLDQQPPAAQLISPQATLNVNPQSPIVLEFSELISVGPFAGTTGANSPIVVRVIKTKMQGGSLICDPAFTPLALEGDWDLQNNLARQVTTASFTPQQSIPSGVCVQVEVTNRVVDLAGTPSPGQVFLYKTQTAMRPTQAIEETFDNDLNLDRDYSSGDWTGGSATPGQIGGDGLHGDFDPRDGVAAGPSAPGTYIWNTDNMTIPRTKTLSGEDEVVTDGVFRFSHFVVSRGTTVRFEGSKPAKIYVRGLARIDGTLDLAGESRMFYDGLSESGQPGGKPGAGGGAGGAGGDKCDGKGAQSKFSGNDGADAMVPAGHAYAAQATGTGGRGSGLFPADGLDASVVSGWMGIFSVQVAAGGGGAGFAIPGTVGRAESTYQNQTMFLGPDAAGGSMFSLEPLPMGADAIDHFVVGGAGGGGSGSHPFLSPLVGKIWRSGGGGGGGGGALGLRVGNGLSMGSIGKILANGGQTDDVDNTHNYAIPGGGGAGGSVVLQVDGATDMKGSIDVRGGTGGELTSQSTFGMLTHGGDGSHGYIRMEVTQTPSTSLLGTTMPDASAVGSISVDDLTVSDNMTGSRSLWFVLNQIFAPDFLRYEIDATVDGQPVTYTDDPNQPGTLASGNTAVQFYVQGAQLDASGQVDPTRISAWRRYVGPFAPGGSELDRSLDDDNVLAVRFLLVFDRSVASQISVEDVRIVYQPF